MQIFVEKDILFLIPEGTNYTFQLSRFAAIEHRKHRSNCIKSYQILRYVLAIVLIDDYFLTVKTFLRSTRLIFNLNYSFSSYQIALHRTEHVTLNHVTQSCHSGASWSWNESTSPSYPITREHIGSGWTYRNVYKRICMYISCSNVMTMSWCSNQTEI